MGTSHCWLPPTLFADVPSAGFFEILGRYATVVFVFPRCWRRPKSTSRKVHAQWWLEIELAKPIESSARLVLRRSNTITLLCDKRNIMLFSRTRDLGFLSSNAGHPKQERLISDRASRQAARLHLSRPRQCRSDVT